ncbi:chromosome segregation protein SMC [Anaerococcus degeneri]|uniref:Chromosome partition protein Smc n=1 Tax=Anaerococcus degeneri TaxID=361500 RepID=A0ABS7YV65_9FIRM|nr:chromosome segregation protein SMC [Anaerococcus degeneri]MCA2095625.1 chromosome segregation protein SMC [Anaerococcus degeneri]
MRLESIELKGFKSFAEKTTIKFDSQITAVVGPNGSGKSNISDAVRWVLGEQSVKSLRGANMKDVIFTGAKSSMNIAEVKLNFSNEDKKLDIPYDKVAITRRIYRSGENEYKINDKRVRLKDIRELFFDTGVGKEGYSIIGQGRIDEIILSSPKDRRAIFEEASGISKHKYRRDEASKKLESVNDDLEIIEKELEYKKKDYNLFKTYKENYLKHRDLTNEINKKSFFYLKNKSYDLIKKRDNLKIQIRDLDEKVKTLESQNSKIKEKLSPFKKDYDLDKERLENLLASLSSYEKNIEKAHSSLKLNEQKLDYDEKDRARISEVLSSLGTNFNKESKELEEKEYSLNQIEKSILEIENDLKTKKETRDGLEKEIKALNDEIFKEKIAYEEVKAKILDYQVFEKSRAIIDEKRKKDLEEKRQKIDKLDIEIGELEKEYESLKASEKKLDGEILDLKEKTNNLAEAINKANEELDRSISSLNNLKLDLKSLLSDYKIEKNLLENNQGYFYPVQDFLKKTKINGLGGFYLDTLANLISVKNGYEEIIDTLIGSGLQNIVTRTKDDTRELINFVNREKLGRLTFLPIDSINSFLKEKPIEPEVVAMAYELVAYDPKLRGIIGHFLGSTVVVKDIDDAISLSKKIKGYRIISLNLDIINTWGSMVAGTNKNKRSSTNLLNRKKKLNDLENSIKNLTGKQKDFEKRISEINQDLAYKKNELLDLKEDFEGKDKKKNNLASEIERLRLKIESLSQLKADLGAEGLDYEDRESDIDIERLKAEEISLKEDLENQNRKLTEKSKAFDILKEEIISLTNRLEINKRDKSLLENSLVNIKNSLEDIRENKKIQEKLFANLENDLEESKKKAESLEKSIKLYQEEAEKLSQIITDLKDSLSKREGENSKLIEENQKLEDQIKNLDLERVKISYKIDSANENYQNLEDEVGPYITMSLDDLAEKFKADEKLNPTKSELIDIQKKINEVGFFTETALEDFDNIDKEVNFIKDQVEDLRNSKADIEKMIVRLEKEMKDEFSKNFAIINENFTKIFKILFMGGDARLILDSEDFLTAGVEIEAKPPSKSLKSISLLSGGEKALTAVALLFAIFEQNPAPFSILDEIDAALDEANIKRYIEYLKGLSDKTQFIMITHRQTTMQLAEKIHGVTIDDEGISKLYSIGFGEN